MKMTMPIDGARTLGELKQQGFVLLFVECDKWGGSGDYAVARLTRPKGAEQGRVDLLEDVVRGCFDRMTPGWRDRWGRRIGSRERGVVHAHR